MTTHANTLPVAIDEGTLVDVQFGDGFVVEHVPYLQDVEGLARFRQFCRLNHHEIPPFATVGPKLLIFDVNYSQLKLASFLLQRDCCPKANVLSTGVVVVAQTKQHFSGENNGFSKENQSRQYGQQGKQETSSKKEGKGDFSSPK